MADDGANARRLYEVLQDELAEQFFDDKVVPVLKRDELPEGAIEGFRRDFIAQVLYFREEMAGYARGPYRTKTGRELSDAEIEALADEAERGYDVADLAALQSGEAPAIHRWDVSQKFVLTDGEFGVDAEAALYKEGVRREMHPGNFRYACYVGAPTAQTAQACAQAMLLDRLRPYGIGIFVFDVRVVALGEPKR